MTCVAQTLHKEQEAWTDCVSLRLMDPSLPAPSLRRERGEGPA